MAPVIPFLSAIGTAVSVAGTIASTRSAAQADQYKAQIMDRQAQRDAWNGQLQSQDQGISLGQDIGAQTAMLGASGFTVASPSAQQRLDTMRILGRRDELRLSDNAAVLSANATSDASMARTSAGNAVVSGVFGVGTDLINGATMANKDKMNSLRYQAGGVR